MKIENFKSFNPDDHKIEVEHILLTSENHEKIIDLFGKYRGKRYETNYNKTHITELIANNSHFVDGILILKIDDEPVVFFGIGVYNNWCFVARYVCLRYHKVPLSSVYLIPELERISMSNNRAGIFFSFNENNKTLYEYILSDRRTRWNKYQGDVFENRLYAIAEKTFIEYKSLPESVIYNYTKQFIIYKSFAPDTFPKF